MKTNMTTKAQTGMNAARKAAKASLKETGGDISKAHRLATEAYQLADKCLLAVASEMAMIAVLDVRLGC
jgi:hypothetical protein